MRETVLKSAAMLAALGVSVASAQTMPDDSYVRLFGGASSVFGEGEGQGPVAGAAIGTRANAYSPWAAEIEVTRRGGDGAEATGAMVNLLRDVAASDAARIYVGGGLGAMRLEDEGASTVNPAAQLVLGTGIEIGPSTEFTVELRHVEAGSGPARDIDASWTELTAGIAFGF